MINPNKNYKQTELATIIEIDPSNISLRGIKVKTDSGRILEGILSRVHTYPNSLKVGQQVGYFVQYSILLGEWRLAAVIKKRSK